jgi:hypothetical protein
MRNIPDVPEKDLGSIASFGGQPGLSAAIMTPGEDEDRQAAERNVEATIGSAICGPFGALDDVRDHRADVRVLERGGCRRDDAAGLDGDERVTQ